MQSKEAVVALRYHSSERSVEILETKVSQPVEHLLISLGRVSRVTATTRWGHVDFMIQFEGGATEQDLGGVENQIEKFEIASEVVITSRTLLIAWIASME